MTQNDASESNRYPIVRVRHPRWDCPRTAATMGQFDALGAEAMGHLACGIRWHLRSEPPSGVAVRPTW